MLEETKERTKLDNLEKMIRNTNYPLEQILDALAIPPEKREQYLKMLSSAIEQRTQQKEI